MRPQRRRRSGRPLVRAAGRVIGSLLVIAVLILVAAGAGRVARAIGAVRGAAADDRAARLLALAIRGLPPQRALWGEAMLGELHAVRGGRARRRFSLGCVRSAREDADRGDAGCP